MSVWREVQEALYERFVAAWTVDGAPRTPVDLGNEGFDPPDGPWVKLIPQRRLGGPGTIGRRGNRKMDRRGSLFILLREPAGRGVGAMSDMASAAAAIFEACRLSPHDIRFEEVEPMGDAESIEGGRWWGVTIEARFEYEEII